MPTDSIGKYTKGKLRAKYKKGGKVKATPKKKTSSFRKNQKELGEICGYNTLT